MREAHTGGYCCRIYIRGHAALPGQKSTPKAGSPNRFFDRFLAPLQDVVITQVRPPPTSTPALTAELACRAAFPRERASPDGAFVSTGTSLREAAVLPNRLSWLPARTQFCSVGGNPQPWTRGSLGRGQAGQSRWLAEPCEARAAAAPGP